MDFVSKVEALLPAFKFSHHGWAALERPLSMDIYKEWIANGHHGEMDYLAEHTQVKEDPRRLAPRARTALVIAKSYSPHPYPLDLPIRARTALYARGEDYHVRFQNELQDLATLMQREIPGHEFLCFADSAPILERDLAYRAGIGWIGKNTCVIHPEKGSLFFLGQILTTFDSVPQATPVADFCGTCDRCIQACPTQAIESSRRLNATKCISYWTIEAAEDAPTELRTRFGDWFFGCDICQTVCPWNEKSQGKDLMRELSRPASPPAEEDLRWILTSSGRGILRALKGSPLTRARPRGLKRNALVIIGNLKIRALKPEVEAQLAIPGLNEIARWALTQLL